jgi:hypothetical protein
MINIDNSTERLVIASVLGEFTLTDFREIEKSIELALKFQGKAKLLLDLTDMLGFTLDVAWEEIRFTRQHAHEFEKIAIVTEDQWLQWSAWLPRNLTDADLQVFENYDDALEWISES